MILTQRQIEDIQNLLVANDRTDLSNVLMSELTASQETVTKLTNLQIEYDTVKNQLSTNEPLTTTIIKARKLMGI
jgi:hypothetical protein